MGNNICCALFFARSLFPRARETVYTRSYIPFRMMMIIVIIQKEMKSSEMKPSLEKYAFIIFFYSSIRAISSIVIHITVDCRFDFYRI